MTLLLASLDTGPNGWRYTCRRTAAKGGGWGDGWGDWRGEVSTGVARRSGNTAARQTACQGQRQLWLHLLLHGLMLSPCGICHEPAIMRSEDGQGSTADPCSGLLTIGDGTALYVNVNTSY